jgi:hypothetical protein
MNKGRNEMTTAEQIIETANEWRTWRELLDEIKNSDKGNYTVKFDADGFWTDNEEEFDDYELSGDDDRQLAIDKNDEAYDNYVTALMNFSKEIGADFENPYGNSFYVVRYVGGGSKTLAFRDHEIADSTRSHHDKIMAVYHKGGINFNELNDAINWIKE